MILNQDLKLTVEHIEEGINTPYSEFGAIEIDSTVYFSSMRFKDKTNSGSISFLDSKLTEATI